MEQPTPLRIPPGVIKDATDYEAKGRWIDSSRIRFVGGQPQPIGGWIKAFAAMFLGTCRSMFAWTDFDGTKFMGLGTNIKWYVENDGTLSDITPIRDTEALGGNPITSLNGSGVVTISDVAHGASVGDYVVISGATAFNNLTTGQLNQNLAVTEVVDADHYKVNTGGTANASSAGGGGAVSVDYLLASGGSVTITSGGWSAGGWGHAGGWGSAYSASFGNPPMGHWSQGNFGEYLVGATRGGNAVYYWDPNVSASRAEDVANLPGAAEAPTKCSFVLIDGDAKYALAFAVNPQGESLADQLHYRWCSQGDLSDWDNTNLSGTAGGNDLTHGSLFMTAGVVGSEVVVFTNTAVFALTYLGPPNIYAQTTKAIGHSIYGYRTFCASKEKGYWWSKRGFYVYNGLVREMDCPLKEWVFKTADPNATEKAYAWFDPTQNEVWYCFQAIGGSDVDTYVKYNETENCWDNGLLDRTSALPATVFTYPRMTTTTGYVLDHEYGIDDLLTGTPVCVGSYITVGAMDINDGAQAQFLKSIWPDVDFTGSTAAAPEMNITLGFKNRPGNNEHSQYDGVVQGSGGVFTDKLDVGMRGRSMSMTVSTSKAGSFWSLGIIRALMRAVGGR